jgi:hypothetical protein
MLLIKFLLRVQIMELENRLTKVNEGVGKEEGGGKTIPQCRS